MGDRGDNHGDKDADKRRHVSKWFVADTKLGVVFDAEESLSPAYLCKASE